MDEIADMGAPTAAARLSRPVSTSRFSPSRGMEGNCAGSGVEATGRRQSRLVSARAQAPGQKPPASMAATTAAGSTAPSSCSSRPPSWRPRQSMPARAICAGSMSRNHPYPTASGLTTHRRPKACSGPWTPQPPRQSGTGCEPRTSRPPVTLGCRAMCMGTPVSSPSSSRRRRLDQESTQRIELFRWPHPGAASKPLQSPTSRMKPWFSSNCSRSAAAAPSNNLGDGGIRHGRAPPEDSHAAQQI